MDPERLAQWRAADALFDQWLDVPGSGRDAWLAAQEVPPPVRARLMQLVAAHRRPHAALDPGGNGLAGRRLGEWTLDSELGRGGMAVVYRAWREQGMARQQAAVKILTLGALGAVGRERFGREAEILARLNHPNVTALVDSGVAGDGTCWLAMPLVEGGRIDRWCDSRAMDAHAIVHLYLQVCAAVAYAHRNLVIHRDIKPSNVLVDDDGHVRLLDFGIGQFADAGDERTRTMWRALTPGYAAPEQLRGDPPSTAVDVYGLGALLHRLLTGHTPQAGSGDGAHTTRPSLLVRDAGDACHRHYVWLKNDLDRVLLKALAEEPEQRYATAEGFADDLRRWLEGHPVLAQRPTPGYRLRKFASRHRGAVAAGVLLAVSLGAGAGATLWQAQEAGRQAGIANHQAELARQEAAKARARAERAEDVRDFLGSSFLNARGEGGGPASVMDLLQAASEGARGEALAEAPLTAADVLLLTGTVRFSFEDHQRSLEDLEHARALLSPHQDTAPGELARAHWELARHARRRSDYPAVLQHARQAARLNAQWDAPAMERFRAREMIGTALLHLDPDAADTHFRELLADIQASELRGTYIHLHAINGMLATLSRSGTPADRLPIEEERLRIARAFYAPGTAALSFHLGEATHTLRALGQLDRAEALARESMQAADQSLQRPMLMRGMARCYLGFVLQQRGDHAAALEAFAQADRMMGQQDDSRAAYARCLTAQAYTTLVAGDPDTALDVLARSESLLRASVGPEHAAYFDNCGLRATATLRRGGQPEAARVLDACVPPDPAEVRLAWHQAHAERLLAAGDPGAAALLAELRGRYPPQDHQREWMRPWMASLLLAARAGDDAALARLTGRLGRHAATAPLSHCLAAPGEATCLALP